ncbi:aminopeptidase N-like [Venturia canescens]|uniref:aminopeptidase N-like n=1 Tax=Venturia canescens TaxID=32260 RepID=UPI001C9C0998|nr:aminopeptidase N-like [Venturia canescens]
MSFLWHALSCILLVALTDAVPLAKDVGVPLNNQIPRDAKAVNYSLPTTVIPKHYTIRLEPNIVPGQFTFKGETDIQIHFNVQTDTIVLHAMNLSIDGNYTELLDSTRKVPSGVKLSSTYDEVTHFYTLKLGRMIPKGDYVLKMKYTGILHDDMNGFYQSSYFNDQGEKVYLATTQFEPTYARRAFPCFDEPSFKAKFKIFITHFENYTAVSNMPAVRQNRPVGDKTKWITEFEETKIMSPYLVAFVVSDFKYLSNSDGSFRVFARNNKIHLGRFAQAIGPKELAMLEKFTNIKYQLSKMDNFAIPQFLAGAMENWGLVTYRESALLYDEKSMTTETKQAIASVISHEFAHQWFGNLVSPFWWEFTWLNEGFANYFQYWITDQVQPEWRVMDQFVTENLQEIAFTADDNKTQHSMDVPVSDPVQIYSIFDSISYSKAGCIIRMFSHVLTPTVFQTGLQNYLTAKSYQVATSDDLIKELVAVGKSIPNLKDALVSWIRQPGYPVVTVIRNHTTGTAEVSQKRFLTENTTQPSTEKWYVPINVVVEGESKGFSETKPTTWLKDDGKSLSLSGYKNGSWIMLNSQQTGYYRVNYDLKNWQLIIDYLKNENMTEKIHTLNRAQLLDDSFHLAQAAELPNHSVFFEMTNYLQQEKDYVPWYSAHRAFAVLNRALANTGSYDLFKLYIQRLTSNLEAALGYTEKQNDTDIDKMNRVNVIRTACAMGSEKCLSATHEMLVEHVLHSNKTSADLQSVVLCAGMRSASAEEWEQTYNYTTTLSKDSDERRTLLNSLGCSSDSAILKMYLQKSWLIEAVVNRNDTVKAVYTGDINGVDVIFSFINDNFATILDRDGNTDVMLQYLVQIASRMTTDKQIEKLEAFIKNLPAEHKSFGEALTREAVSKAKKNVEWVTKYEKAIQTFLEAQGLVDKHSQPNSSSISLPSITLVGLLTLAAVFRRA